MFFSDTHFTWKLLPVTPVIVQTEELFLCGTVNVRVQSSVAEAVVRWNCLPDKMNPVVRPLMDSLRREEIYQLQVSIFLFD